MSTDRNPKKLKNYKWTCACGFVYPNPKQVPDITKHEADKHEGQKQEVTMQWIGKGPPPFRVVNRDTQGDAS